MCEGEIKTKGGKIGGYNPIIKRQKYTDVGPNQKREVKRTEFKTRNNKRNILKSNGNSILNYQHI